MRNTIAAAIAVLLLACGSATRGPEPVEAWPQDPDGNFVLYVSNQSFDLTPVDVTVTIDGKRAVAAEFDCGDQHNWVKHVFSVPPGAHVIRAVSTKGEATLEQDFTISDRHWAALDFWYYAPQFGREMPRQFSFEIQDEPMRFR